MRRTTSIKALTLVALCLAVALAPFLTCTDTTDAAEGDHYRYTVTTNLTVTDSNGDTMSPVSRISDWNIDAGSWEFDEDGYGPFNSFYAALNPSNGKMMCILDPDDLGSSIDGATSVDGTSISNCNIMWVLPTVYIGLDGTSLVMSDEPFSGSKAYAHTIDGRTYNYLALGVYEAYYDGSKLMSKSGAIPTQSKTLIQFRDYANNGNVDSGYAMLWNWHQYQLYRVCALMVMGSFDSQATVGAGNFYNTPVSEAGLTDKLGPYTGSEAQSTTGVKLFIENVWGNVDEFLDDCYWNDGYVYAGQNTAGRSTGQGSSTVWSGGTSTGYRSPGSGYSGGCSTDLMTWGMPTYVSDTRSETCPDWIGSGTYSEAQHITVGGSSSINQTYNYGLSHISEHVGGGYSYIGTRIAMVFDDGFPKNVTLNYDSLSSSGASSDLISSLPQTIGIKADGTTVYPDLRGSLGDLTHIGWYVNGVLVAPGTAITMMSDHTAYISIQQPLVTMTFVVEGLVNMVMEVPRGSVGVVYSPERITGEFKGWYYDQSYTNKYDASVAITSDITLYAKGVMPLEFTSVPTAVATITNVDSTGLFYFDATDSESCYSVHWDFGDGNTSSDRITYNYYERSGTYNVTLTVTNAEGQSAISTYSVENGTADGQAVGGIGAYVLILLVLCIIGYVSVRGFL